MVQQLLHVCTSSDCSKKNPQSISPGCDPFILAANSLAVSILGNAMNIPVLAIADGTDVNLFPSKYRAWSYARDILNKKISNIIFVSEALRAAGNAYGLNGGINTVLHNAVDVHVFTPGNGIRKDGIFTIFGVGGAYPPKVSRFCCRLSRIL